MSVLCVDPGATWGWSLLDGDEVVAWGECTMAGPRNPSGVRWASFRDWLRRVLDGTPAWGHTGVSAIVYEQPFGRYVNALQIGFAQVTLIDLHAHDRDLEYMGVQPSAIKIHALGKGSGNARKEKLAEALEERHAELRLPRPESMGEHEVDAIWMAALVRDELRVAT